MGPAQRPGLGLNGSFHSEKFSRVPELSREIFTWVRVYMAIKCHINQIFISNKSQRHPLKNNSYIYMYVYMYVYDHFLKTKLIWIIVGCLYFLQEKSDLGWAFDTVGHGTSPVFFRVGWDFNRRIRDYPFSQILWTKCQKNVHSCFRGRWKFCPNFNPKFIERFLKKWSFWNHQLDHQVLEITLT